MKLIGWRVMISSVLIFFLVLVLVLVFLVKIATFFVLLGGGCSGNDVRWQFRIVRMLEFVAVQEADGLKMNENIGVEIALERERALEQGSGQKINKVS